MFFPLEDFSILDQWPNAAIVYSQNWSGETVTCIPKPTFFGVEHTYAGRADGDHCVNVLITKQKLQLSPPPVCVDAGNPYNLTMYTN